jgi:hypothetical protein
MCIPPLAVHPGAARPAGEGAPARLAAASPAPRPGRAQQETFELSSLPEAQGPDRRAGSKRPPRCYFCSSTDTMAPFRRSARIFLLSALLPLRWRYCRRCARHFVTTGRPRD